MLKVGDMTYDAKGQHFVLGHEPLRLGGERAGCAVATERRRSLVHFARVLAVKSAGIELDRKDEVLPLLAIPVPEEPTRRRASSS